MKPLVSLVSREASSWSLWTRKRMYPLISTSSPLWSMPGSVPRLSDLEKVNEPGVVRRKKGLGLMAPRRKLLGPPPAGM